MLHTHTRVPTKHFQNDEVKPGRNVRNVRARCRVNSPSGVGVKKLKEFIRNNFLAHVSHRPGVYFLSSSSSSSPFVKNHRGGLTIPTCIRAPNPIGIVEFSALNHFELCTDIDLGFFVHPLDRFFRRGLVERPAK